MVTPSIAQGLPHDILRELFEHLAIIDPAGVEPFFHFRVKRPLGWIVATHVCAHWREAGLTAAALWAEVVSAFPDTSIADELVSRSRDALLTIKVALVPKDTQTLRSYGRHLPLDWGVQHLHRARKFRCLIYGWSTLNDNHPGAYADPPPLSPCPSFYHLRLYPPQTRLLY